MRKKRIALAVASVCVALCMGASFAACTVVEEHEHTWDAGVSTATCTEDGTITYTCTECGATETMPAAATGHSYESETTTATCTAKGKTTYTCSKCGYSYDEETEALGHSYEVTSTTATCTSNGRITYTCSRCGASTYEETEALGHSYEATSITATCTTGGVITYTCSRCKATYTENVSEPLGHDYVEKNTATCEEAGEITYVCSRCGDVDESRTESVDALGHDYTSTTTATCTADGETTYTCTRCGDTYTEDTEKLGHNYVFDSTNLNCVGTVLIHGVCSRCGEEVSFTNDGVGHNYVLVSSTEATCTEDAVDTYECTRCSTNTSNHYKYETTAEKLGHDWGEWEETGSTTYDGIDVNILTRTCTRDGCGATETEYEDAAHHFIDVWDGESTAYDWLDTAVESEDEESGETITTYTISTCADLAGFAAYVNGDYTVSSDVDFTLSGCIVKLDDNVAFDLNNHNWTPIGVETHELYPFSGTFDGNGSSIYNLYIKNSDPNSLENENDLENDPAAGLFGLIESANITNVTIENVEVSCAFVAGGLVGMCSGGSDSDYSTISNCTVKGVVQITGSSYVGGIVGLGYYAAIESCFVIGNEVTEDTAEDEISFIKGVPVTIDGNSYSGLGLADGSYVGGIVGYLSTDFASASVGKTSYDHIYDSTVENLVITGEHDVGGLLGGCYYNKTKNSIPIGTDSENPGVGCSVKNCTISATYDGTGLMGTSITAYVGAIMGSYSSAYSDTDMTISNCTITDVTITAGVYNTDGDYVGYYGGYSKSSIIVDNSCTGTVTVPSSDNEETD